MSSELSFSGINEFSIQWRWVYDVYQGARQSPDSHIHDACEIYVNVSGNVSFMVENHIYPISHGDIIITAPNEYHHCILHGKCIHEHFWALIPVNKNDCLYSCFLNREHGTGNLISLPDDLRSRFLSLCYSMNSCKGQKGRELEQYSLFLQMLSILNRGYRERSAPPDSSFPKELLDILDYINDHYRKIRTVKEILEKIYVSQSTLNRLFRRHLGIRPYEYIEDKKIAYAKKLLLNGKTVLYACYESGFSDCSHFISVFRKKFGITPFQYKKQNQNGPSSGLPGASAG